MSNVLEMKPKDKQQAIQKDQPKLPRNWYVWATAMAALSSSLFLIIFWCTNIFEDSILSTMAIRNGSSAFDFLQRSPVRLLYKVYIFNYTNVNEFESGKASKLKVEELGPYYYRETLKRVNIQMHENHTVSYQEERSFQWEGGKPDDEMIVVPNIPLLTAVSYTRDMNFAAHLFMNIFLSALQLKTFVNVNAGQYLWGYDDELFSYIKTVMNFKRPLHYDKFGIMAPATNKSEDRFLIHTGTDDINKIGLISKINGETSKNVWSDEKCNKIYGTDGSVFPPDWVRNRTQPLYVYAKDMCRPFTFLFDGYNETYGIPTLRYKMSMDLFNSSKADFCFCPKSMKDSQVRKCPPVGIFNSSACNQDVPLVISFPHFYNAEKSVYKLLDGIKPDKNLHESYLDLHQRLTVPIAASSKVQLNVEIRKSIGVPYTGNLQDGMILPLIWCDRTIDRLPKNVYTTLYDAHYIALIVELFFRWGSIIVLLGSIFALVFTLRKHRSRCNRVRDSS